MEEKTFYKLYNSSTRKNKLILEDSFILIDEYDNLFDMKKTQPIIDKIKILKKLNYMISFTGSQLSKEERECLNHCFKCQILKFPQMNSSLENSINQRRSFIYQNTKLWLDNLVDLTYQSSFKVPVIIALNNEDIASVKKHYSQNNILIFDLVEYNKKGQLAELTTIIEQQFPFKIDEEKYGIYLINQDLGRGTDFPSSTNIENNGGIDLVLGDVFDPRITSQIKGRVCRMQNKGQFQYIVEMKNEGLINDYIMRMQNILHLKTQSTNEALLTQLRQQLDPWENAEFSLQENNFFTDFFQCTDHDNNKNEKPFGILEEIKDTYQETSSVEYTSNDEEYKYPNYKKGQSKIKSVQSSEFQEFLNEKRNNKRKAKCKIFALEKIIKDDNKINDQEQSNNNEILIQEKDDEKRKKMNEQNSNDTI